MTCLSSTELPLGNRVIHTSNPQQRTGGAPGPPFRSPCIHVFPLRSRHVICIRVPIWHLPTPALIECLAKNALRGWCVRKLYSILYEVCAWEKVIDSSLHEERRIVCLTQLSVVVLNCRRTYILRSRILHVAQNCRFLILRVTESQRPVVDDPSDFLSDPYNHGSCAGQAGPVDPCFDPP